MTDSKIRFALIGAGRIGKIHGTSLATRVPDVELVAIADVNLGAARELASILHVPRVEQDYTALLDDPTIDAIAIASWTETHVPIIEQAAARGKHLFCEKPISLDLAQTDHALAAVERAGIKLQIGFNRRFDADFARVRELIAAGRIGTPNLVHITSRDPAPPSMEYVRVSGGMFLDMTIHDFDMARFLIGSEIREVYAVGAVRIDPMFGALGDIDTAVTVLQFENGVIGTIDNSRAASYGYDQRARVLGTRGAIETANETPDQVTVSDAQGIHTTLPHYFFLERYAEAFAQEMIAFAQAIRSNQPPPVTGHDARIAVVVALAANKSLQERRPVRVDEIK